MIKKQIDKIRLRIAPSPTGYLHIGTARIALFNYLFSKQNKGDFILRIEDTDIERSEKKFEDDIIETLKWLGLEWTEGPYRQSERKEIYKKYLKQLISEDKAYYCFCSEEELEAQRQDQMARGEPAKYFGKCASLPKNTALKMIEEGKPATIRFRTPTKKVHFNDMIRGRLEFDTGLIGDMVIAKSLNDPLYNFAVVVDDFEMEITHIVRGEDHISNTPKQILIQEAFGFYRPQYAHIPLTLGPDKTRLSKRHGATAISAYRKGGYLPEALINFMAFLGWNPGDEREIFSLPALIKEFSFEKMQKSGAIFNQSRLDYLNGFYIRHKSIDRLTELCIPYLIDSCLVKKNDAILFDENLKKIISVHQERLKKLSEISEFASYFFESDLIYEKELLRWKDMTDKEVGESLKILLNILEEIDDKKWNKESLEKILMIEAEKAGDRGKILWPLRAALTGKKNSASPFEVADILGKEKTLKRLKNAHEKII